MKETRTPTSLLFAVSSVISLAAFGCHGAVIPDSPERTGTDPRPAAEPPVPGTKPSEATGPGVGTDPGHAGQGTPLAAAPGHELAAFAAGCFWGVEDAFRRVPGVSATAVGYSGGHTKDPTYERVCEHDTGHAETVLVEFDPAKVSYERLVAVFFRIHDPTTLDRQGPDIGDQYRSAIFTFSAAQEAAARAGATKAQTPGGLRVVTQIFPMSAFYKAEGYHQQFAERTGDHGCPIRDPGEGT